MPSRCGPDHDNYWCLCGLMCWALTMSGADADEPAPLLTKRDDGTIVVAGKTLVNPAQRQVILPATVNQREGLVEYLLVHTTGKRHEALLVTTVEPQHLHAACLLVGAPETGEAPTVLSSIEIRWHGHGPENHHAPEALLLPATHDGRPLAGGAMPRTQWTYVASRFTANGFAAQREGSCIALQADPLALMNAPALEGCEYIPEPQKMPPVGSHVRVVLTFLPPTTSALQDLP